MRHTLTALFAMGALAATAQPASAQIRSQSREGAFQWSGDIGSGQRVYLLNINGALNVQTTSSRKLEVTARETWRRGDPGDVTFVARRINGDRDLVVCAIWRGQQEDCDERGYKNPPRQRRIEHNDVQVEFTMKLPAGVHVTAHTVNGDVEITGASGDVDAETVNGNIDAESTAGSVDANTVNGDIHVRMARVPSNGTKYETVNGSVSIALPSGADANILASTVSGSVSSDFPITVSGSRMIGRTVRGTIGRGGPRIEITTVHGAVRITRQ